MTPLNRQFIRWLANTISCERFATHVARGVEPLPGGILGRFYFWLHWFWCPYCRRYWDQIQKLGALQRSNAALAHHPRLRVPEIKARLKSRLRARYA